MKILLVLSLLFAGQAFAQDRGEVARGIRKLSVIIEDATFDTDANIRDLTRAKEFMQRALRLVNNRGGGSADPQVYKECLQYAYEKYRRGLPNSGAMDRAQDKCTNVVDMDVLRFLFEKHFRGLSNVGAMDKATEQATYGTKEKLHIIEFAYKKHFRGLTSSGAATKAVLNAKLLRVNRNGSDIQCLQKYYDIYFRSLTSSAAMDKSAEVCSRLE